MISCRAITWRKIKSEIRRMRCCLLESGRYHFFSVQSPGFMFFIFSSTWSDFSRSTGSKTSRLRIPQIKSRNPELSWCHQALSMASWTRSLRQWGKRFMIGSVTLFLCSKTHSQQRPCLGQSDFGQEQYSFIFVLTGHSILLFSISIPPARYLPGQLPHIGGNWN